MSTREFFIERFKAERPAFLNVIRALPQDKLDYKPHERNSTAGQDVFHVWRHQYQLQREGRLEGWYRGLQHGDDPLVAEMVSRGDVVRDVRLKRFMESIVAPPSS